VAEGLRRVVSGVGPDGRSGVLSDGEASGVYRFGGAYEGFVATDVWSVDELSLDTDDRTAATDLRDIFGLLPGSSRFRVETMPPTPAPTGWHRTSTIDYEYIVSGEMDLFMEDGTSARLVAGDVNVQLGGLHQWWNRSAGPCVMVIVMLGVPSPFEPGVTEEPEGWTR